ncbi:hypothetical protein TVAG_078080 [Trichomonas vaginalis G3]|uniref:Uncharacterized protein n=1 Tax=Trichomonas vaginalis (strain ATCC PRA-98 / G3) TaxID=412133 RepID=A2FIB1_TRIV3|nr:hypothetical protein TVAGG3_0558450 [Trichomonas vaginalis G3]EAX95352.1 hypothetical protein TVAG_078080 [Trichomonas vaginalis G3]KAI5521011.1 hypothetical protein TVAGG3_0558450 [Trichomonas vaginalis G3]|eukprot:XP_001308282.1 hypothetical protein [Trichomonas vaginalis G3]
MIGSDVDNWPCYGVSHCLGIWTTVSYNTELPFHSQSEDINISKNLKFLEYMIYAVDNQKWPSQIDFDVSYYFEQDIHREIIAIDPKASILVGCDFNKYLSNLKQNISQDKRCGEENNLYTNYMPAE